MNRLLLIIYSLFVLIPGKSWAAGSCDVLIRTQENITPDLLPPGMSESMDRKINSILRNCVQKLCIAVSSERFPTDEQIFLVSGQRVIDIKTTKGNIWALAAAGHFQNAKLGMVCIFASYGGGSSGEWNYDGVTKDGTKVLLVGSGPVIAGDLLSPEVLINALNIAQNRAKWKEVHRAR